MMETPPPPPHTHPMFSSPPQAWRSLTPWIRPRLGGTGTPPDSQEKGTQPPPALSTPKIWHLGGRTRNPSASHTQLPHIALRNPPPPHIHPPKYPPITCREGGTRSPPPPQIPPPQPPHTRREGGSSPTTPPLSSPLPPQICPRGGNSCPPAAPSPPPHPSQPLPSRHWDPQGWGVLGGFGGLPPRRGVSVPLRGSWCSSPPPPPCPRTPTRSSCPLRAARSPRRTPPLAPMGEGPPRCTPIIFLGGGLSCNPSVPIYSHLCVCLCPHPSLQTPPCLSAPPRPPQAPQLPLYPT